MLGALFGHFVLPSRWHWTACLVGPDRVQVLLQRERISGWHSVVRFALDRAPDSLSGAPPGAPPLFSRGLHFRGLCEKGSPDKASGASPKNSKEGGKQESHEFGPPDGLSGALDRVSSATGSQQLVQTSRWNMTVGVTGRRKSAPKG